MFIGILKHRSQVESRLRDELEEKKREGEELFLRSLDDEKQKGKLTKTNNYQLTKNANLQKL